ncbi:MAG: divalent-cation tolerance protein CutA [Planctomycetota bacterium]
MSADAVVVLCTAPIDQSEALARAVVEERLCACVNIVPKVVSVYRWQGAVETAEEHLLVAKTTVASVDRLQQRLAELHPYDVPEVIQLPIAAGLPAYLEWLAGAVVPDSSEG